MKVAEFAKLHGVTSQTVRRWIAENRVDAKPVGRTWNVEGPAPEIRSELESAGLAVPSARSSAASRERSAKAAQNSVALLELLQALLDTLVERGALKVRDWRTLTLKIEACGYSKKKESENER